MTLRIATIQDIPALSVLLKNLFSPEVEFTYDEPLHVKALTSILKDSSIGHIAVVEEDLRVLVW